LRPRPAKKGEKHLNQKQLLRALVPVLALTAVSGVQAQNLDFSGDIRFGYYGYERDERNGTETDDEMLRLRVRAGLLWTIDETWSFKGRYAARVHNKDNNSGWVKLFDGLNTGASSIVPGESTLDEFFVRARYGKWDHRIGRFQTNNRLVGVAAKSFSRTNSTGWDVGYTDGIQSIYRTGHGFNVTGLIEYNDKDGTSNLRRSPLDFRDSSSRTTYYVSIDAQDTSGLWAQRSVDVTYIPSALYYNGVTAGQSRDYLGFTGRAATQVTLRDKMKLVTGAELAWAPETQRKLVAGLPGTGKTDSFSWHVSANLMDFAPGHSIGLVHGQTEAGWLLSTDFQSNSKLTEVRYAWVPMSGHLLETRVRQRRDLNLPRNALRKRSETDMYFRYSISI
jgi:hypothetical protein